MPAAGSLVAPRAPLACAVALRSARGSSSEVGVRSDSRRLQAVHATVKSAATSAAREIGADVIAWEYLRPANLERGFDRKRRHQGVPVGHRRRSVPEFRELAVDPIGLEQQRQLAEETQ